MTDDDKVVRSEADLEKLRRAADKQGFDKLADGTWFERRVGAHVKKHAARAGADHWDRVYPGLDAEARAAKEIQRVVRLASAAGAAASVGASTGELLSLVTEGLGAPIGVPAAMASMAGEALYTALLQTELACDLASIYGAPFDPDDFGELSTLFGLAFEVPVTREKTPGTEDAASDKGVTATLISLEDGELAKRIGRKLLEESVMRNIVPFVGVAISARWNWVATRRFAAAAQRYARYRRALRHACTRLQLHDVEDPGLVLQGAWLLATVDGTAGHEELLALALILEALPPSAADAPLDDDEEPWFERLARAPEHLHHALFDTLYLVAATDREVESGERRFLRRVGRTIGREVDTDRIEQIAGHLGDGDDLPEGFISGTAS